MQEIKCPKCKIKFSLTPSQIDLLKSRGMVLCSCPACKHFFDYKYSKPYKRPVKYMLASIFGKRTPLNNGDIVLNHSDCHYNAAQHSVSKRVVIPNGPQGYVEYKIPLKIKTHEELSIYLDNEYGNLK